LTFNVVANFVENDIIMNIPRSPDTSHGLIARVQSSDQAGWHRLVGQYSPLVRYWFRRWGVDEADLDDLTQEVWLALGPTMRMFDPGRGRSFRGWLRGVATHKAQDWYRRRLTRIAEAEGGSAALERLEQLRAGIDKDDPTDPGEIAEIKLLYRRKLLAVQSEFEDRTWKAFLGVVVEAQSSAEVAAGLGMSAAAVRMAKSRVVNRLRQELADLIEITVGQPGSLRSWLKDCLEPSVAIPTVSS
jgi:RNA polymerase sigma-70 factor (ECF subfamily)